LVQSVVHQIVTDAITTAGTRGVADNDGLSLIQLDTR